MHLAHEARIIRHHQADGLGQTGIGARRSDQPVIEDSPVKRLVFGPHRCEQVIGVEVMRRHAAQTQRCIGQCPIGSRQFFVGNEPGRNR